MATRFSELTKEGLDADDINSATDPLDVSENTHVGFSIVAATGPHIIHKFILECSFDQSTWSEVGIQVVGIGFQDNLAVSVKWVRVKIKQVEGNASTVDVIIQAK